MTQNDSFCKSKLWMQRSLRLSEIYLKNIKKSKKKIMIEQKKITKPFNNYKIFFYIFCTFTT